MTNSKRTEITIVTHEVAVIHGDVATTPSGDPEDGNAAYRQRPGPSKPCGGFGRNSREEDDMKIGVSEQRLVLGEGSTARRNPWLRLSLGIVGSIGAISTRHSTWNSLTKKSELRHISENHWSRPGVAVGCCQALKTLAT
jgi:hypothetical protein